MKKLIPLLILTLLLSTLTALAENPWGPGLPDKIDAACNNGGGKSYFFSGSQYWRWDNQNRSVDAGYPKQISAGWSGIPNDLDAATYGAAGKGTGKLYLFKGSQYWRWDIASDTMDSGYPKSLSNGWPGLSLSKIDCALRTDYASIVFFSGDQFWHWNMQTDTLREGPLPVSGQAPQLPANLDAAIWDDTENGGNGTAFFKGDSHWNIETSKEVK
jgi:hemopexin